MTRTLFTITRYPCLIPHPGGQITDNQPYREHYGKGKQVLDVGNGQRSARSNKEEIEAGDVNKSGQNGRPASVKECDNHHAQ